ncbi:MAG: hypothetical protein IPN82_12440 [Chitinophagaceae bacterium]|nr:hypothetical protein [Chitinophagaceae bacterium]
MENKTSLEQLRNYTMWYWRNHIKQHFYQEEKILIPYMPKGHAMAVQLKGRT